MTPALRTPDRTNRRWQATIRYEFYASRFFSMLLLLGGLFLMLLSWMYIYGLSREAGWLALAGSLPLLAGIALHRSRWRLLVFAAGAAGGLPWFYLVFALP